MASRALRYLSGRDSSTPAPAGRAAAGQRELDDGLDDEREAWIELGPGQSLAIDFRAETGGFIFG
jgi:hypothetical protein